MIPGCAGRAETVVASVLAGLLPQALFAITEMVPPEVLVVTVIVFEVDDPVHPDGRLQV